LPRSRVKFIVSLFRLWIGALVLPAFAAGPPLDTLLKNVETRYNRAQTLQVLFNETYAPPGQIQRTESGTLLLRKPGRMRWNYSQPKGKLFVSDGKYLWLYTPDNNQVERRKLKESEDMRAPLAFLLGKLNFKKEFRNIQARAEGDAQRISAEPVSDNLPYSAVEFVVAPDFTIREVKVTGFDRSVLTFRLDQEKLNPALDSKLFEFRAPAGATVVDSEQ
jgi:outer membrane lipoprotein carrier protein